MPASEQGAGRIPAQIAHGDTHDLQRQLRSSSARDDDA